MILFFFNDTATTEIYTLSLHDALPICGPAPGTNGVISAVVIEAIKAGCAPVGFHDGFEWLAQRYTDEQHEIDRKSTRLNSSHANISYAVFCLKKKKNA